MADPTPTPLPAPAPGFKTKGFWLTLAATAVAALTASGVIGDGGTLAQGLALGGSALLAAGYASLRSFAKGAAGKPAWRTTEFWMTAGAVALGVLATCGAFPADGLVEKAIGTATALLASLGYSARAALPPKV